VTWATKKGKTESKMKKQIPQKTVSAEKKRGGKLRQTFLLSLSGKEDEGGPFLIIGEEKEKLSTTPRL